MSFTYEPISGQGYATFLLEGEDKSRNTSWMPATNFTGLATLHGTSDALFFDGKVFTSLDHPDPSVLKDNLAGLLPNIP